MNAILSILRYTWATAWYTFAVLAVLLAVLFSSARLMLPHAENYRIDIEHRLSDYLGQPARVAVLDAELMGLEPQLLLKDVTLLDADGESVALRIEKIRLGLDIFDSLFAGEVVFSAMTLIGVDLTLTRYADGRIAMQGLAPREGTQEMGSLTHWLFSQGELRIEDSTLFWLDQYAEEPATFRFSDVNIGLRNTADHHWLDVSLSLPDAPDKSVSLLVDLQGDPLAPAVGRRSRAYISGEGVNISRLLEAAGGLSFRGGEVGIDDADFQVWVNWLDGRVQGIRGNVDLQAIHLSAGEGATALQRDVRQLVGDFVWQKTARGWQFDADNLVIDQGGRYWLPSRVSLAFDPVASAREAGAADAEGTEPAVLPASLDFAVSFMRLGLLSDLLPLASTWLESAERAGGAKAVDAPALLETLRGMYPRGEIHDLRGRWQVGQVDGLQAYARFEDIDTRAWQKLPEVTDATGRLWLDGGTAQLSLERAALVFNLPKTFRDPLPLEYLSGQLALRRDAAGDGWQLQGRGLRAGNADIRSQWTLDLQKTAGQASPFISLVGHFEEANGRVVPRYLPRNLLKSGTLAWLETSIQDGFVPSGDMVLHGRLADFPYVSGNGHFEVRFEVEGGRLDYARDWPAITDIDAEVLFEGASLQVKARHGHILGSSIRWARVGMADMKHPPLLLTVDGEVEGATQNTLDYLRQSPPLARKFGAVLENLTAQGDSLLALQLQLPLKQLNHSQVAGSLSMTDNVLRVRPLGEVLSHANGTLNFSSDGIEGEGLSGELLGQPASLAVHRQGTGMTRIQARGRFDIAKLSGRYLPQVADLVSGDSEWDVTLDVPVGAERSGRAAVLRVNSDMLGIASRLPAPLQKRAEARFPFALRVDFPHAEAPQLRLDYGEFLSGIFEFGDGGFLGLRRGELRFSQEDAVLPQRDGLRVVGWLDHFSLDDWSSILGHGDGSASAWLTSADITLREMVAYGQTWHNLGLRLQPQPRHWTVEVSSDELRGTLQIPRDDVQQGLVVDLAYCRLAGLSFNGADATALDPRELPPIKLSIGDLQYKYYRYGAVQLETLPVHNGLKIKRMRATPEATELTVTGGWFVRGGQQYSQFDFLLDSRNIEKTLKAFGYLDTIQGGKGTATFSLKWPGSPFMDDERMRFIQGKVKVDWRKGQLLDVDPGAGRLFGLMSLQTLPRRLILDFSDVFREGFRFDLLQGDFLIDDGDAYTSNLRMIGPAAQVAITGRTGLVARDYDQLVTVTPSLSDTLPILGALAIAPPVGAAMLLVQKLIEPEINKATAFQYTITGSWEKPNIVKVKKPQPKMEPGSFFDE